MKRRGQKGGVVSLFLLGAFLSYGCAKTNSTQANTTKPGTTDSPEHYCSVATKSTGFFHYSPSQEVGPDKFLVRDTVMVVLRPSFAYSRVKLMNGEEGYVASKDLRVAPPALATPTVQIPTAHSTGLEPTPLPSPR
jgi:hypothetical protein